MKESWAQKAKKSVFQWNERGDLVVHNAVFCFTNFKGKPTDMNPNGGKRTFTVGLPEEVAMELKDNGWNIKSRPPRDDQDDVLYYTEVNLNMEGTYEPRVVLYTEYRGRKSQQRLHGDDVGVLDGMRCSNIGIIIHPYEHNRGQFRFKGYCNELRVVQEKQDDPFREYDEYEEPYDDDGEPPFDAD